MPAGAWLDPCIPPILARGPIFGRISRFPDSGQDWAALRASIKVCCGVWFTITRFAPGLGSAVDGVLGGGGSKFGQQFLAEQALSSTLGGLWPGSSPWF